MSWTIRPSCRGVPSASVSRGCTCVACPSGGLWSRTTCAWPPASRHSRIGRGMLTAVHWSAPGAGLGPRRSSPHTVHALPKETMPNGLQCSYVSKNDLQFLYNEVYANCAYMRHGVSLGPGDTVVDVGGNIGFFAMQAAEAIGESGRVVCAEPIPMTCQALQQNIEAHRQWLSSLGRSPPAPVTILNAGVSDGSADHTEFTFYKRAAGWSTMSPNPKGVLEDMRSFLDTSLGNPGVGIPETWIVKLGRFLQNRVRWLYNFLVRVAVWVLMLGRTVVRCKLKTVSEIIEENDLRTVSLLKVDVERAELAVLHGIKAEHWPCIRQVVMEVHDEGGSLAAVKDILENAGFSSVVTEQDAALVGSKLYNLYCRR